ncbi:MAG TPA: DUF6084 family protein [Bryobacteraceae bacterium]|nr:DUF6084 family protein [Bryobacteraceae bacterium]
MPDLHFEIIGAAPVRDMATPALAFDLRVSNNGREPVRAVLLRCQIQIETARRRYSAGEQDQLRDLFDEPQRWGQTLRPLLWINASVNVPAFTEGIVYPISVPCTYDLNVPVTKYFHALAGDTVPLTFLFSGTVFYEADRLQAAPISWNKEAHYRLPVQVWKDLMDLYYPDVTCLCLRRDVVNELYRFKVREGIPTFEEAILRMCHEHSNSR